MLLIRYLQPFYWKCSLHITQLDRARSVPPRFYGKSRIFALLIVIATFYCLLNICEHCIFYSRNDIRHLLRNRNEGNTKCVYMRSRLRVCNACQRFRFYIFSTYKTFFYNYWAFDTFNFYGILLHCEWWRKLKTENWHQHCREFVASVVTALQPSSIVVSVKITGLQKAVLHMFCTHKHTKTHTLLLQKRLSCFSS